MVHWHVFRTPEEFRNLDSFERRPLDSVNSQVEGLLRLATAREGDDLLESTNADSAEAAHCLVRPSRPGCGS